MGQREGDESFVDRHGAPADLKERLYDEHRIEIPVVEHSPERMIRPSFQATTTTPTSSGCARRSARCSSPIRGGA